MSRFLSPTPARYTMRFAAPQTNHQTASGLGSSSFRVQGRWDGTLTWVVSAESSPGNNPQVDLSLANLPGAGFFVDLPEEAPVPDTTDPVWVPAGTGTDTTRIKLALGHGHSAGALVSVRQSGYPAYVTARRIHTLVVDPVDGNRDYGYLDTKLPQEFFPLSANTRLEYCLNRPHVRARFLESPQSWAKNDGVSCQTVTSSWEEDNLATVAALRSISGASEAGENALLTESGQALLTESGEELQIEF